MYFMNTIANTVLLFVFFVNVYSEDCIFENTVGAVNAAAELAVSAGQDSDGVTQVTFAPASVRSFPEDVIEEANEQFFDSLLRRRHNSRHWLWATLENSERRGTGMAHIIGCATERFARSTEPDRHSLCVATVAGDHTSEDRQKRCDGSFTSLILIGETNNDIRPERVGTKACWCEEACTTKNAVFSNTTEQGQAVTSYVILEETENAPTMKASQYEEENKISNDKWYDENLVKAQAPFGKGLFPRERTESQSGTAGRVLRSLRVINILEPFSSDYSCTDDSPSHLEDRLHRRVVARVEEELGRALQQGISAPLTAERTKRSNIVLTVAAALAAVVVFEQQDTIFKLISEMKNAKVRSRRLLILTGIVLVLLFEVGIELLPIYFMLQEEIAARDLVENRAFEVVGMGNELGVIPLVTQSGEEFVETASGFVLITLRNTRNTVAGIAVVAAILTCITIGTIARNIRRGTRPNVSP